MREMKASGIEWIGEIPKEWKTASFKRINRGLNTGEAIDKAFWSENSQDIPFYTAGLEPIYTTYQEFPTTKYTRENDILLARNGTPYVYMPVIHACYTDHIIKAELIDNVDKRFIQYGLQQSINSVVVDTVSIPTWSASLWNEQIIPMPNLEEQSRIADYLDKKCAQIDALIAAKEKTNALLKERRQSIIYEAVTKGLDPNAPMKDSGIEWIGMIPEDWNVERLKYHIDFNPSTVIPKYIDSDMVSFLPMECLKSGTHSINEAEYKKVKKGYVIFQEGDILMAKVTPCLENGNLAVANGLADGVGFGSTEINVIRCKNINREYLFYILQTPTFIDKAVSNMYGVAGLKRLAPDFIPNTFYPIPPIDTQKSIVDSLNEKCAEFDSIIKSNESTIEKLKEYRQSVIYEAVTGKVEV